MEPPEPPSAGSAPVLDYLTPQRLKFPLREIVVCSLIFAGVDWVVDTIITYFVMVRTHLSIDPGQAAAQIEMRTEKFFISTIVTSVVIVVVTLIVLGVQCAIWRARPVADPGRVRRSAIGAGLAYCAVMWTAWSLSDALPLLSNGLSQLAIALVGAIGVGLFLGSRRRAASA
jgi:hypothetical protein